MKNNLICDTQKDAARIYDAFITAVALPELFGKEIVQLTINTLKRDLQRDHSDASEDDPEKIITEQYVQFLEKLI